MANNRYDFRIIMPADADRLSVPLPVSLAVIGRRAGGSVSWECPSCHGEMRISTVAKPTKLTV